MVTDPVEDAIKDEHVMAADPGIIPLDGGKEMEIRAVAQFLNDPDGRETLVRNNDASPDVVIQDE